MAVTSVGSSGITLSAPAPSGECRCGHIPASARVSGVQSKCKRTFFWRGWQKIVAQIRGVFRKIIIYYPFWGQNLAPKHIFTPIFRLHTVTTGSGLRTYGYFLRTFHVPTEIYPMVPFPPSLGVGVSDYTSTPLRWTPLTRADAVT
jgi:hypothetical protein